MTPIKGMTFDIFNSLSSYYSETIKQKSKEDKSFNQLEFFFNRVNIYDKIYHYETQETEYKIRNMVSNPDVTIIREFTHFGYETIQTPKMPICPFLGACMGI